MNAPGREPTSDEAAPAEAPDPLLDEVRVRSARHRRWLRDGEPSVARRLAQIGVLGWLVVTPMLLGVFAGRWLDRHFGTGLFWTGPLLLVGLGLGCWSGWKWIRNA